MRRAAVLAVVVLTVAGCTDDDGAPGPDDLSDPPPTGAEVSIVDFDYEPADVRVTGGETVVFTNDGDTEHTATADDGAFDSGRQQPGESFTYVTDEVDETTTVEYHCDVHPQMTGELTVEPARRD